LVSTWSRIGCPSAADVRGFSRATNAVLVLSASCSI